MGRVSDARERLMDAVSELIWTGSYGRTTIDQICERAGVKKGSFYYFFKSKADLAAAAIDVEWTARRAILDGIFSATIPPLDRLSRFCELELTEQVALAQKHGYVLGCPLCTLGAEVSTSEQNLRSKVEEIMGKMRSYLESAIRDAQAQGMAPPRDVKETTDVVFAYLDGLLTQARIQNNVDLFKGMQSGVFLILGVRPQVMAAA